MGPGGVGPGGATRARPPQHPHACETDGVIRCGLQARLDMGPHGVPHSCQLSSQSCNGGSLEAQLSDRPADHPRTQTRPGGRTPARLVPGMSPSGRCVRGTPSVVHATGSAPGPRPRTRRSPPPPHAHDLERSLHNPGSQPAGCTTQHRAPGLWGARHAHQMEGLQVDDQIALTATIKRLRATSGRVRHCRGP